MKFAVNALSFSIFKSKYLKNTGHQISNIKGRLYEFMYQSYYGGAVDSYIPKFKSENSQSDKLYYYDVNSIYPSLRLHVMKEFPMPIGDPYYLCRAEGNILEDNSSINFWSLQKSLGKNKLKSIYEEIIRRLKRYIRYIYNK